MGGTLQLPNLLIAQAAIAADADGEQPDQTVRYGGTESGVHNDECCLRHGTQCSHARLRDGNAPDTAQQRPRYRLGTTVFAPS